MRELRDLHLPGVAENRGMFQRHDVMTVPYSPTIMRELR